MSGPSFDPEAEQEVDFGRYVRLLAARWWLLAAGLLVGAGYRPFMTPNGWDQTGILRVWRPSDGVLLRRYDSGLSIGVTSNVAFTTDSTRFVVGLYNGTTLAARS